MGANHRPISTRQGRAMGRLSEIVVRLGFATGRRVGCMIGGGVGASSELQETLRGLLGPEPVVHTLFYCSDATELIDDEDGGR